MTFGNFFLLAEVIPIVAGTLQTLFPSHSQQYYCDV